VPDTRLHATDRRSAQRAWLVSPVPPAEEQRRSLLVHTGLASAAPHAVTHRWGQRVTGAQGKIGERGGVKSQPLMRARRRYKARAAWEGSPPFPRRRVGRW
jgi:hypothetical protein